MHIAVLNFSSFKYENPSISKEIAILCLAILNEELYINKKYSKAPKNIDFLFLNILNSET